MPSVIDYPTVLKTMESTGFKSLYYNSGAFGFTEKHGVSYLGWTTSDDPTLRPEMRALAIQVERPAELARRAWQEYLPGLVWVMPMSHWAYELDFGSRDWMPTALQQAKIDPAELNSLTTGNAIEFTMKEGVEFALLVDRLLDNLKMSDFMLAFPGMPVICTVHHHRQLWWASNDLQLLGKLQNLTDI
ncbi:MAG TPA: hypothetical protein VFE58_07755 [Tepidisphaeraceae bacterium]|jgi:hypothetical protein|nr:hypothetical protein [Tepidisphaeraceae bacterium]